MTTEKNVANDYAAACKAAADDQGITAIIEALASRGITADAYQSGGFCMSARVSLDGTAEIHATMEGACFYATGDMFDSDAAQELIPFHANAGDTAAQRIDAIADGVCKFIARIKDAAAMDDDADEAAACIDCGVVNNTVRDDWELNEGRRLCCDCNSDRLADCRVPQEWIIEPE